MARLRERLEETTRRIEYLKSQEKIEINQVTRLRDLEVEQRTLLYVFEVLEED